MLSWCAQLSPEGLFESATSVVLKGFLLEGTCHSEDSQVVLLSPCFPKEHLRSLCAGWLVGSDGGVILQQGTARGFGLCAAQCSRHADLQSDKDVTGEMSHQESFEAKGGLMGLLLLGVV